jgi:hypothetical protein
MTVRQYETSAASAFALTGTQAAPVNGITSFAILPATAASLATGSYRYDIKVVKAGATYAVQPSSPFELLASLW